MMMALMEDIEIRRKRLKFRAWHRGTREMDLLLGSFADQHLASFDQAALDQFESLLVNNDPDLYSWVSGREEAPAAEKTPVMDLLLRHQFVR